MLVIVFVFVCFANSLGMGEWQREVLDLHNELRSKVASGKQTGAPTAQWMQRLEWDPSLANQAQTYAEKCIWTHDKNRGKVGENIAYYTAFKSHLIMVQKWYDEVDISPVADYNKMTDAVFNAGMGHYTQVIWADSDKLGCGLASCAFKGNTAEYLVCRYNPPGNYVGRPIYQTGQICGNCKGICNEGLCTGTQIKEVCWDKYSNCHDLLSYCYKPGNEHITKNCCGCKTGSGDDDENGEENGSGDEDENGDESGSGGEGENGEQSGSGDESGSGDDGENGVQSGSGGDGKNGDESGSDDLDNV